MPRLGPRTTSAVVLTLALGVSMAAQPTNDFTGVWTLAAPSSAAGGVAAELRVTFETSGPLPVMVVEHRFISGTRFERHQIGIDGGTVRGNLGLATGPDRTLRSVRWRGETLVIVSGEYWGSTAEPGPYSEHQEVWALESPDRLVIAVTDRRSSGDTRRRSLVYTRTPAQTPGSDSGSRGF